MGVAGGGVTIGPLAPKARVKSSAFWLTPEQLGETEPLQPPWSRPSDQNASRPTPLELAQLVTVDASATVKVE